MKKLQFSDMIIDPKFDYHAFNRITPSKSSNKIGYFIYFLDNKLSLIDKKYYEKKYNNIKFIQVNLKYAPEIQYSAIMVYDKVLK